METIFDIKLVLIAAVIYILVAMARILFRELITRTHGVNVNGTVVSKTKGRNNSAWVTYTYQVESGEFGITKERQITRNTLARLTVGSSIKIQHKANEPKYSVVVGDYYELFGNIFGGCLMLFVLMFGITQNELFGLLLVGWFGVAALTASLLWLAEPS